MSLRFTLRRLAAWAPGIEDEAAWEDWARAPAALPIEGVPDAKFLPAMLRRRCTPLTRMMLRAAFDACAEAERAEVRTVFASRHGSINESIELIEAVVRGRPLSPAVFSHTVHNAQAGLFSIAAANRCASSSMAAQEDTFLYGWLEALLHLEREPDRPVLLVMGDAPLAPTFAALVDEATACYAVAFLIEAEGGEGTATELCVAPAGGADPSRFPWPTAAEFARSWLSQEPALTLVGMRQRFTWTRG